MAATDQSPAEAAVVKAEALENVVATPVQEAGRVRALEVLQCLVSRTAGLGAALHQRISGLDHSLILQIIRSHQTAVILQTPH